MKNMIFILSTIYSTVIFYLMLWLFYLAPMLIVLPLWYFGRKRICLNIWDYSLFIIPYTVWFILLSYNENGKTVSNYIESPLTGIIVLMAPIFRIIIGNRINQNRLAFTLLLIMCIFSWCIWYFMPKLPE
jgi:hypothetical protein